MALGIFASAGISSANAAVANATVGASIIGSLTTTTALNLSFGNLSAGPIPGTVVISSAGNRTSTGGAAVTGGGISSPATFVLVGNPNATYAITLPAFITISDSGANSMIVDNFESTPAGTGLLDAGGNQILTVGGRLNVLANQISGSYYGVLAITIVYN